MSSKTTYKCDRCTKEINSIHGITISWEPEVNAHIIMFDGDICSDCFTDFHKEVHKGIGAGLKFSKPRG